MERTFEEKLASYKQFVVLFSQEQAKFNKQKLKFENLKEGFYRTMETCFDDLNLGSKLVFNEDADCDEVYSVNRIQKSTITFNPEKLEKVIGKDLSEGVITKKCSVTDVDGFLRYLKSVGADPKIVKSFLIVSKSVDENELDRLEAIGKINADQIKDCYDVKTHKPYFTVKKQKGSRNE